MKKAVSLLCILILCLTGMEALARIEIPTLTDRTINALRTYSVSINFPTDNNVTIRPDSNGISVQLDGYSYHIDPGKPMLPSKTYVIALPPGAKVESIDIKGVHEKQLPGKYMIKPAPMITPLLILKKTDNTLLELYREWEENYQATYSSPDTYPNEVGKIVGKGAFHEFGYVALSLFPFRYHPLSRRVFQYDSAIIYINYKEEKPQRFLYDSQICQKASELFINYNNIKNLYQVVYQSKEVLPTPSDQTHDYVIISTNDLYTTIASSNFMNWKSSIGYKVKIVNITDAEITSHPGYDLAEQIRTFLRNSYMEWGIKYVLIVGNYDNIPMRYCYPDKKNHKFDPSDVWGGEVPTDYYYADLSYRDADSWDSDRDGFYGEYGEDNPDFLAEVIVGRIPTNDATRVAYTLDKSITFESDTGEWKNNALDAGAIVFFTRENNNPAYRFKDGARIIDIIESDLMDAFHINHYSEQQGLVTSSYSWHPLSAETFTKDWRTNRYSIVNIDAHGWTNGIARKVWITDDGDEVPEQEEIAWFYFLDTTSSLDDDYPSIFFDMSCLVGYPEPNVWGGNLGIDLLTKPGFGASIGVVSATRLAYGASARWPSPPGGIESLCYEFNKNMLIHRETVGEALYDSKFFCTTNYGFSHYYEYGNMYDYNLYGDPSLRREGIAGDGRPSKPSTPWGPSSGKIKENYNYSSSAVDPNGDQIYYWFDWGDGTNTDWLGPFPSGENCEANHTWNEKGNYEITVRAKDSNGIVSEWSDPLPVSMPKNKEKKLFFFKFLDYRPQSSRLLRVLYDVIRGV